MDKAADLGVIIALVGLVAGIAILAGAFVGAYFFGKSKGQLNVARDPELLARITRIEQIVESTSIEIERITEGQRFTTKLLSDRQSIEK